MREDPPEEFEPGGRSVCGYSCTCTCSARWSANTLIHCVHLTCSGGKEPKEVFSFSNFGWILQIHLLVLVNLLCGATFCFRLKLEAVSSIVWSPAGNILHNYIFEKLREKTLFSGSHDSYVRIQLIWMSSMGLRSDVSLGQFGCLRITTTIFGQLIVFLCQTHPKVVITR